ncbi:MAG: argininosuccinate lyase [Planctomycetota bacterium]|jgi:argininosuccinate lyase
MKSSLWQSRLPDRTLDPVFEKMNASIETDSRLFREEIAATKAHACALRRVGVYTNEECERVRAALCRIEEEIAGGEIALSAYEDIHTVVELRLTELAGPAGAKIQTARSRNEQTQTAQRLFLKQALRELTRGVEGLQAASVEQAEGTVSVLMPGYTHGRPAQPVRFAHYLCALVFGLERDKGRLRDAMHRVDRAPAGSAALAGASFPVDREELARSLGFASPAENALDAVSDRDGPLEALSALAILMVRLSRLAEDLIQWSSPAYGFLEIGDAYCTSSSLMPQKKNPDGLELVRGKTGRVVADLVSLLVTCKGLPTGYQKDLQEDKEPLFDALDTASDCLAVAAGVIRSLEVDAEKMRDAVTPECLATDFADRLVEQGVPFREAFDRVARAFAEPGAVGRAALEEPSSPGGAEVAPEEAVERRDVLGGTSERAVTEQIRAAREALGA